MPFETVLSCDLGLDWPKRRPDFSYDFSILRSNKYLAAGPRSTRISGHAENGTNGPELHEKPNTQNRPAVAAAGRQSGKRLQPFVIGTFVHALE